jgi:hypothetical protein
MSILPRVESNVKLAALQYAQKGWSVFPCHTPIFEAGEVRCSCGQPFNDQDHRSTKHPRVKYTTAATTDTNQIKSWWAQWPTATVGIYCAPSNLLVMDFDDLSGEAERLLSRLEEDAPTFTVFTGGGGWHLYYKRPTGWNPSNYEGDLPKGINVRGSGYVIAAPSMHQSGNPYTVTVDIEAQEAPTWLLDRLQPKPKPEPQKIEREAPTDSDNRLWQIAFKSKMGTQIRYLFDGGFEQYSGGGESGRHLADLILCNHLAFYTQRDPNRIDRMFRQSGLYREKWDRDDYRNKTISMAIHGCKKVFGGAK